MKYGWRPSLPDQRDKQFISSTLVLPKLVDLRNEDTPIYDQGQLGSCTANAIAAHLDFNRKKQGEQPIVPSRLFIYYNERAADGTVDSDAGSTIRESAKTVKKNGAPPETLWPYLVSKFKNKPTTQVYKDAVSYEDLTYLSVRRLNLKDRLAEGYPVVIGISVYESFESPAAMKTGVIPMPEMSESLLGGHAVMLVGYNEVTEQFIFRNSWSSSWGASGYGFLPYAYLSNSSLSSDFWSLNQVK